MQRSSFEIRVSGVPYRVDVDPFQFNEETRFKVRYNGGEEHIFAWDSNIGRLAPIDDASAIMPDDMEREIAVRIERERF